MRDVIWNTVERYRRLCDKAVEEEKVFITNPDTVLMLIDFIEEQNAEIERLKKLVKD